MTSHKREARRREIEAHNARHEKELAERRARALFRYICKLCGAKRKDRMRTSTASVAQLLAFASGAIPYFGPEDML